MKAKRRKRNSDVNLYTHYQLLYCTVQNIDMTLICDFSCALWKQLPLIKPQSHRYWIKNNARICIIRISRSDLRLGNERRMMEIYRTYTHNSNIIIMSILAISTSNRTELVWLALLDNHTFKLRNYFMPFLQFGQFLLIGSTVKERRWRT